MKKKISFGIIGIFIFLVAGLYLKADTIGNMFEQHKIKTIEKSLGTNFYFTSNDYMDIVMGWDKKSIIGVDKTVDTDKIYQIMMHHYASMNQLHTLQFTYQCTDFEGYQEVFINGFLDKEQQLYFEKTQAPNDSEANIVAYKNGYMYMNDKGGEFEKIKGELAEQVMPSILFSSLYNWIKQYPAALQEQEDDYIITVDVPPQKSNYSYGRWNYYFDKNNYSLKMIVLEQDELVITKVKQTSYLIDEKIPQQSLAELERISN